MDIAAALTRGVYEQGAEYFKLMIVATGERSVFPNVGPTDRILKRGDVCRVEIFPMIGGYHAGVCRTAAVGAPPPQAERIWANLIACKYLLLDAIKPGASSRAIYDLYLEQARRARPAADLLHRPRHRPAPARRPLSRADRGPAARSRHGARHRAADLRDRLRLRHAEQGHGARHRRAAASCCRTMPTPTSYSLSHSGGGQPMAQ